MQQALLEVTIFVLKEGGCDRLVGVFEALK